MPKSPYKSPNYYGQSGSGWSAQRVAICALFTSVAIILSFIEFPLFPAAPYLKYDPSGIICVLAGFAFGPIEAAVVSVLMWTPHFFGNPLGALMGVISSVAYAVPAALVYRQTQSRIMTCIALTTGGICSIVLCLAANLVVTPLYTPLAIQQVIGLIIPVLLPFNALKILLNSAVTLAIYKRVIALTRRS